MKRPTLGNENMVSLYSGRTYLSPSSKTNLAAYQKSLGLSFNSPKSEPQKNFAFPQKPSTINNRSATKIDRADLGYDRKNPKFSTDSYPRTPSTSSTYGGLTPSSRQGAKLKGTGTKTSSADKFRTEQYDLMGATPKQYSAPKFTESLNLKDSLLKQTRARNLEISTEIQAFKATGGLKAYSTKNKDPNSKILGVSNLNGTVSNSSIDYASKYGQLTGNKSATNMKYDYVRTEPNEEKASLTPTTKQKSVLNKILANTSDKNHSSALLKKSGGYEEVNSSKNNSASASSIKINNFFASAKRKELENSLSRKDKSLNLSVKLETEKEEVARSTDLSKKAASKVQLDYKNSYKALAYNDDSKDDIKRQEQDSKNLSLSYSQNANKDANKGQKASLNSFITKVEKGAGVPLRPKKDDDMANGQARPYLTLEDKASAKNNENMSRTTTNADNRSFGYAKNKTPTSEIAKTKGRSSGPSTPLHKESSELVPSKNNFTYYSTSLEKHHRNWNDSDYFCQIYKEHFIQSFQALTFCKYLRPVDPKVLAQKKVFLPKKASHKDKKSIIFDLDETLIHCNESTDIPSDVVLPIKFPHGEIIEAGINIRPYAVEILKEISQHFEVIIFTASHACYANVVLDYLDPQNQYIHHRLFRDNCVVTDEGIYIKDLRILGNRNLQDIVLVDNAAYSFGYQIENGIPIIPYYDNKEDEELKHLIPYLKSLAPVRDVRDVNKQAFRMQQYTNHDTLEKVLNKVVFQN